MNKQFPRMYVLDCRDLDTLVTEEFGLPYSTLQARALVFDGVSQNTYQEVDTGGESWQDEDAPTVQQWLDFDRSVVDTMTFEYEFERRSWLEANTPTPDPETMIRYLVERSIIPGGKYLIQYWW